MKRAAALLLLAAAAPLAAAASLAVAPSAAAAPPSARTEVLRRLDAAESARRDHLAEAARAAAALAGAQADAARLASQRVRAAAELRQVEGDVISAAARLHEAQDRSAAAAALLRKREADLATMLPVMLRLEHFPAETVLAVPAPPDRALEGLLVTRGLAVQLQREAALLRAERAAAEQSRQEVGTRAAALALQRARQDAAAAALDRQIASTDSTIGEEGQAVRAAQEQAAAQAAQADTLRGAIAAMDAARARAAAQAAADARLARRRHQVPEAASALAREAALARPAGAGRMQAPVAGPILRAWGSPAEDGPATGITFGTAPGAFVSSPCTGRVAFAAPFRSYGKLIIVECGGGIDVVLAGLDRLDAAIGHAIRAGEPLGRMADGLEAGAHASLYVELRRAGRAENPAPFLNTRG